MTLEELTKAYETQQAELKAIRDEKQVLQSQNNELANKDLLTKWNVKPNLHSSILKMLDTEKDKEQFLTSMKETQPEFFNIQTNINGTMNVPKDIEQARKEKIDAKNDEIILGKCGIGA